MKFPTMEEMAKEVAEKALDEYEHEGKTIRQWVEILKDYDDKQATLQRIAETLDDIPKYYEDSSDDYLRGKCFAYHNAAMLVREEGLN